MDKIIQNIAELTVTKYFVTDNSYILLYYGFKSN